MAQVISRGITTTTTTPAGVNYEHETSNSKGAATYTIITFCFFELTFIFTSAFAHHSST
jgi:hypothetical protein